MWEKGQELDVTLYIHPMFPSDEMLERYKGDFDGSVAITVATFAWGWHSDTGLHILRLFASSCFDGCSKLKIFIGHMGGMIPFQIDRTTLMTNTRRKKERGFIQVLCNQYMGVTTSEVFYRPLGQLATDNQDRCRTR